MKTLILLLLLAILPNAWSNSAIHYLTSQKVDNSNSVVIIEIVDNQKFKKFETKTNGRIYYSITGKVLNTLTDTSIQKQIKFNITTSIIRRGDNQLISELYSTVYPKNNLKKGKQILCFLNKNKENSYSLASGSSSLEPLDYNIYIFSYFDIQGKRQRILCNNINEYINLIQSHINYPKQNSSKYKYFTPESNWSTKIIKPNTTVPKRVKNQTNQNSINNDSGNEEFDIFNDTK